MNNVILLTIDVLRRDALGCYGNETGLTPFIDSLQDKYVKFNRAQATGPYTQASFPGILTSSHYLEYGAPGKLSPKRTLVTEPLKQAGIVTAGFHSNAYLSGYLGWNRAWDMFYDSMEEEVDPKMPYVRGDAMNQKAIKWLTSHVGRPEPDPFFLWLHYMDIHEPYVPERKYVDMVDPDLSLGTDEMFDLFRSVLHKRDVSEGGAVSLLKKLYDAHVRETDEYVGQFFDSLERLGLLSNTVIIITADHGEEFSEHGGLSHDDKMYRELIDVPLLIYCPEREKGEECDLLVSTIDIPPTIMHIFGLEPHRAFEGRSLLPFQSYPEKGCYGEAIHQVREKGGDMERDIYFYREKDLKIIYQARLDAWELYDMKEDPGELQNIVATSPEAERMKSALQPRVRRWQTG